MIKKPMERWMDQGMRFTSLPSCPSLPSPLPYYPPPRPASPPCPSPPLSTSSSCLPPLPLFPGGKPHGLLVRRKPDNSWILSYPSPCSIGLSMGLSHAQADGAGHSENPTCFGILKLIILPDEAHDQEAHGAGDGDLLELLGVGLGAALQKPPRVHDQLQQVGDDVTWGGGGSWWGGEVEGGGGEGTISSRRLATT